MFTRSEIDEVFDFIEHTKGMSINGKEISCFMDVYGLISGTEQLVLNATLVDYIEQVSLLKDSYESFGCEDCSLFDKIIQFLKNMKNT
jgi:hypothetical protein